ncbi:MAG: M24 family metallopeptidase [Bacteroidetes bacterium]|nr:M24 family metallopeptidase [Bacteroidota bacterium]
MNRIFLACIAITVIAIAVSATAFFVPAHSADDPVVLSVRKQAEVIDKLLEDRLDTVVPALMRREGIDMWIVAAREYNEDPVIRTMLPATWIAARRRTILVFYDRGEAGIERLAVARYNIGTSFKSAWNPEEQPDQWARLAEIVEERNPAKIGINVSDTFGHADGLTASERDQMTNALPTSFQSRLVSAEKLAVGWLETRTQSEMEIYPMIVRLARSIISEGLSEKVIQPGVTRTDDVEWWYRERIAELNLITWFHPSVDIQRPAAKERDADFSNREEPGVIQRGDLLHIDFGITYLRLNTDTQMLAYVLKQDEKEAPQDLREALKIGNRLQDILTDQFVTGRTGNEILHGALAQAKKENINATIYTHPIGFHGHAAGPTIGLWDQQGGVPGSGDYPLYPMTAYSIELNAAVPIPSWDGQTVRVMLEEDALFDGSKVTYIDPRQEKLLLIPRQH